MDKIFMRGTKRNNMVVTDIQVGDKHYGKMHKTHADLVWNGSHWSLVVNGNYLAMAFYTQKEAADYCKRHNLVMRKQ
jgi:hypothetical protein